MLEGLVKLQNLNVGNNHILNLYVQNLPSLTTLFCSDNHMQQLAINNCPAINEVWAPYNDLTAFNISGTANQLAFVNLEWNDLTTLTLSNLSFLQRLNVANNQLSTLDVSNDPNLRTVIVTNNDMLVDFRTEMCPMLTHVVGAYGYRYF